MQEKLRLKAVTIYLNQNEEYEQKQDRKKAGKEELEAFL